MSFVPTDIGNLIKARCMLGSNAPSVKVTLTGKSTVDPYEDWERVATQYSTEYLIDSLVVYHDEIYGSSYMKALLLKWNGTDAWSLMASQPDTEVSIASLVVFNDKIYGGSYNNARLYEWNGTDAWVKKADKPDLVDNRMKLLVYNDTIYGISNRGHVYSWNNVDAWVLAVESYDEIGYYSTVFNSSNNIEHNGKMYSGTGTSAQDNEGHLFEWDGVSAEWTHKVYGIDFDYNNPRIDGLVVYNGLIYAGTAANSGATTCYLLRWDGSSEEWEIVASIDTSPYIPNMGALIVYRGRLYAVVRGVLYLFDDISSFEVVCAAAYSQTNFYPAAMVVENEMIYAGTGLNCNLFRYSGVSETNEIRPTNIRLSKEEAANAQSCSLEVPNVNPIDPADAGYYSPYRSGTDFPAKTENDWRNIILPSKEIVVQAGYGSELATVFTGSIDRVSHATVPRSATLRLECRDYGWRLVDKTIIAVVDGADAYYIDYPIDAATTPAWLTSEMFVVMQKGSKMVLTSDQGGPVTISLDYDTYTGAELATELETKMNANGTLTGGAITFDVSWNGTTREFTIDAGAGHTIAYTNTGSTAGVLFGMTEDVAAAQSIVSVEGYTATIETIVKDLLVRAGFSAADITIEPTYMLLDPTFERMSYGDAIEEMCTLSGFELVIDEYGKPQFRYPSDRQPETEDTIVLSGTTWADMSTYPVVSATIVVSSETLKEGTIYVLDTDYEIEAGTTNTAWKIRRKVGGAIGDGATVYVNYVYAAWIFTEGQDIFQLDLSISRQDLYGKIVVEGDDCSGKYEVTNPRWDGSTVTEDRVLFVLDENLDTDEKCQKVADRLGSDMMARVICCEFAAVAIPWIQVGDCVQIIESSSTISEIYRITSIDFEFSPMSHIMTFKAYHYGYAPL